MIRTLMLAGCMMALVGTAVAVAESDPIVDRQELMKGNGKATKDVGGMLKGDVKFDLATVQAALKVYVDTATKAPALFPDTSKTGHDTEALPAIWTAKPDFEAKFVQFGKDATAAMALITDEASFKANMGPVLKNCGACHETYRLKKS